MNQNACSYLRSEIDRIERLNIRDLRQQAKDNYDIFYNAVLIGINEGIILSSQQQMFIQKCIVTLVGGHVGKLSVDDAFSLALPLVTYINTCRVYGLVY